MIKRSTSEPPCPRCRRLTGVEDDESTGSSLLWFVCRLCGHRWSVAPNKTLAPDATCTITVTFRPTAVGTGEAVMTIVNDNRTAGFKLVGTALAVRFDANGDGVNTLADLIIRNANGQAASGPHDPRDGNSDGAINVADARYCQLRLTPQ